MAEVEVRPACQGGREGCLLASRGDGELWLAQVLIVHRVALGINLLCAARGCVDTAVGVPDAGWFWWVALGQSGTTWFPRDLTTDSQRVLAAGARFLFAVVGWDGPVAAVWRDAARAVGVIAAAGQAFGTPLELLVAGIPQAQRAEAGRNADGGSPLLLAALGSNGTVLLRGARHWAVLQRQTSGAIGRGTAAAGSLLAVRVPGARLLDVQAGLRGSAVHAEWRLLATAADSPLSAVLL